MFAAVDVNATGNQNYHYQSVLLKHHMLKAVSTA
jgi:hypothetical protein